MILCAGGCGRAFEEGSIKFFYERPLCKECLQKWLSEYKVDEEIPPSAEEELYLLAALVCGYNHLAKQSEVLGDRLFFRLLRGKFEEEFLARGGERFLSAVGGIELRLPSRPELPLYEADVEALRAFLAERDRRGDP